MTRTEHKTPVSIFGEEVLLCDITADITVRSDAEALTIADENGWDDVDLIAKACALRFALSKDGESVFDSGVQVLETLTETEVRRLYALAQGRASDITVPEDEKEPYSESVGMRVAVIRNEKPERRDAQEDAFEAFGAFSREETQSGTIRDECERISEFICRDARRYDDRIL